LVASGLAQQAFTQARNHGSTRADAVGPPPLKPCHGCDSTIAPSGGEVEIGKAAAEADRTAIARMIGDMDLIIHVVGLGGGTCSATSVIVAEVAAKTEALVLAFATLPFSFEGARRKRIAKDSIGELRQFVHGLIPLPNDVLLQEGEEDTSVLNAFAVADHWIGRGVNSLCATLLKTGLINL